MVNKVTVTSFDYSLEPPVFQLLPLYSATICFLSQIEFILDVLSRMPKPLVRWRNRREFIQTWGKNPVDKFWKWLSGSYWKPDLVIF